MKIHLLRTSLLAVFLILCAPLLFQTQAQAKKINYYGTIYPVAEIPDEIAKIASTYHCDKLGYKCYHIQILYADLLCWDKELVMFKDDPAKKDRYKRYGYYYREIPKEIREFLGKKYPFSEAKRNLWNKYGIFVIIIVAISLFIIWWRENSGIEHSEW